jgi:hypothetical protein
MNVCLGQARILKGDYLGSVQRTVVVFETMDRNINRIKSTRINGNPPAEGYL